MRDDQHMMENSGFWPQWPVLPVKRTNPDSDPGQFPDMGVLVDASRSSGVEPVVYRVNMWELLDGMDVLATCERDRYETFEDLVAAGWVVD